MGPYSYMNDQMGRTFHIGASKTNTKVIEVPSGILISPNPINTQMAGWTDTFSVKVEGTKLTVTRIDKNEGWGQDLHLREDIGLKHVIHIGESKTNSVTVDLPKSNMYIEPKPVNELKPGWNDTFTAVVNGKQVTVTRTDAKLGWGMDLKFDAYETREGYLLVNGTK